MVTNKSKQGLDAGGFLLLAKAHLDKVMEKLLQEAPVRRIWQVRRETRLAVHHIRYALRLFKQESEEEPCKP